LQHLNYTKADQDYSKLYFLDMMKFVRIILQFEDPYLFKMIINLSSLREFDYIENTFSYKFMDHMLRCGLKFKQNREKYDRVFDKQCCPDEVLEIIEENETSSSLSRPFRTFLSCILKPYDNEEDGLDDEDVMPGTYIEFLGFFKKHDYYTYFQSHDLENECSSKSYMTNILETPLFYRFIQQK